MQAESPGESEVEAGRAACRAPRVWAGRVAVAMLLVLVLLSFASHGGGWVWWLDLPAHARPQLAAAVLVAGVAAVLAACRRRWVWALVCAAGLALSAGPLWHHVVPVAAPPGRGDALTIVHANVSRGAMDIDGLAAFVRDRDALVVLLQEVDDATLARCRAALPGYHMPNAEPRDDTRGVAVFIRRRDAVGFGVTIAHHSDRPFPHLTSVWRGERFRVLGFSTRRPTSAQGFATQASDFAYAADWCADARTNGYECIFIGDFNSTSQGVLVRRFARRAGVVDARRGWGWRGTYPSRAPAVARVPIDQAFASPGLRCTRFVVADHLGGDHRAIAVTWVPVQP